jgi:hypothetical protein
MVAPHDVGSETRALRVNIEAQVAEGQLMRVLQDVISSSLKTCRLSMIIGVRTSRPAESRRDLEEAQRVLADRRQPRVVGHAIVFWVDQVVEPLI